MNAEDAENDDRLPMTRAVAWLRQHSPCLTVKAAKEALAVTWDGEWHHVGRYAARTNYYDWAKALRHADHAAWAGLIRKQVRIEASNRAMANRAMSEDAAGKRRLRLQFAARYRFEGETMREAIAAVKMCREWQEDDARQVAAVLEFGMSYAALAALAMMTAFQSICGSMVHVADRPACSLTNRQAAAIAAGMGGWRDE